jgi:hypothetical protein
METETGFSLKIRLGDILTMAVVILMSFGVMGSIFLTYVHIDERVTVLEAKVDLIQSKTDQIPPSTHK